MHTLQSCVLKYHHKYICEDGTTSCFWTGHEGKLLISCVHEYIYLFSYSLYRDCTKELYYRIWKESKGLSTFLVDVVVVWVWLTILLHILQKNRAVVAYFYHWPEITGSFWTVTDCDPGLSTKYCHVSLTLQCRSEIVLTPLNTVIYMWHLWAFHYAPLTVRNCWTMINTVIMRCVTTTFIIILGWQTTHQKQWDG